MMIDNKNLDNCGTANMSNSSSAAKKKLPNRDRCAACYAYRTEFPSRKFFKFPKDSEMSQKWKTACSRPYLMSKTSQELNISYKLCSSHFKATDYASTKMCRLKASAFPTQFDLIESNSDIITVNVSNLKMAVKEKLTLTSGNQSFDLSVVHPIDCSTPKRKSEDNANSPSIVNVCWNYYMTLIRECQE